MRGWIRLAGIAIACIAFATPAFAQCSAEGPNLTVTQQYIAKVSHEVAEIRWDIDTGNLRIITGEYSHDDIKFMNVPCASINASTSKNGHVYAYLNCSGTLTCVTEGHLHISYPSNFWDHDESKYAAYSVEGEDLEQTRNLARAFQHLVFLLQASYRQTHNANDPFASPK